MEETSGLVLLAEVVGARPIPGSVEERLAALAAELNDACREQLAAEFVVTEVGRLRATLRPDADALGPILRTALAPHAPRLRWSIAREAPDGPPRDRERLVFATGRQERDALLNDMAPALVDMLDGLTPTQREVARMAIVEGLRQSEVAERVGKRRATVSVSFGRAKVVPIERLVAAMRRIYAEPAVVDNERAK